MNDELRNKLDEVTESNTAEQYLERFTAAMQDSPHAAIQLESKEPISRYTCFVEAFEFTGKSEYEDIARWGFTRVYASPDFAHWLLDHQLLSEISASEAVAGDIVFYFNSEGRAKHAGVYVGCNRVRSKWGKGSLFEHELFAVPKSYGESVRYFHKLSYKEALGYFKRFARERGMLFVD